MNASSNHQAEKSGLIKWLGKLTLPRHMGYVRSFTAGPPPVPLPCGCSKLSHPQYACDTSEQWFAGAGIDRSGRSRC
jgi:hypothetical protein